MWALDCIPLYGDLDEPLERDGGLVAPRYLAGGLVLSIADQKHNVIFFSPGNDLAESLEMDTGSVAPA